MSCSYKLSEAEVVSAMKLHGKGSDFSLVVFVVVAISLVLIGIFTKYTTIGFGAAAGGIIGYFFMLMLVIPFNAKRQYRQHRALQNEITMMLLEQGINFKSKSGESKLQWSDIHRWKYAKGIYLLYITTNMFHIVPERVLSSETNFNKLLGEHIGPKKS